MVHSAQGHADRVTICEWLLQPIADYWAQTRSWDTNVTINQMRSLIPAQPSNPMSPGLPIELSRLIRERDRRLQQTRVSTLPNWNSMKDIDMTVGFDSWLIYIVRKPCKWLPH